MNKYKLTPIKENIAHNDWRASSYKDVIIVCAEDENDARILCYEATSQGAIYDYPSRPIAYNPWGQAELVECECLKEKCCSEEGIISPEAVKQKWASRRKDLNKK